MSIPTYAELRQALIERGTELGHPWKTGYYRGPKERLREAQAVAAGLIKPGEPRPHKYGKVVYFEGGAVGGLFDGEYLVARGDEHGDSVLALARRVGITQLDNGVPVDVVTGGEFWMLCLPPGWTPPNAADQPQPA